MPPRRRSPSWRPAVAALALLAVGFAVGYFVGQRPPAPPPDLGPAQGKTEVAPKPQVQQRKARATPPARGPRVAIVVDDLGRSREPLAALERLGVPITCAVLPYEAESRAVAKELAGRRAEFVLHLPMESESGEKQEPHTLLGRQSERELAAATAAALAELPGVAGLNNHQGSLLTADRRAMRAVLGEVRRRGLYFLDSRTSAESVAFAVARELEVPAAQRQVFLDDDLEREAIRGEFARLLRLAEERGGAIAIGHPHPTTLAVLAEEVPRARAAGFRFVSVSALLER